MRYSAVASIAFVGAVAAQNSTTAATGCVASYNTCRTTRVNGLSANQAQCASDYATCLGENPFSTSGGLVSSFVPYSATASSSMTSSAAAPVSTAACQASYNACRVAPDANMSTCASEYAGCLQENPFAANGTNTVTSAASGAVYVTEVVTALTTVCPAPTAGAYVTTLGKNVYTVSSATTITVTDCPCTISKPMTAATTNGAMTPSAGGNKNGTASTTKPAVYTGAAAQFGAGFGFLGAAAGAVMLL